MKNIFALLSFVFIMALLLSNTGPVLSTPADSTALVEEIMQKTSGKAEIAYHSETGLVRFLGSSPDNPIYTSQQAGSALTAEAALTAHDTAIQFLETYGSLFGLQNPQKELNLVRNTEGETGHTYLRYQQVYEGIPVLGGELIVTGSNAAVTAALGEILPDLDLNLSPSISAAAAQKLAVEKTAKTHGVETAALAASEPALWIHNPALLGGPGLQQNALVWRVEVTPQELLPIRELVLVEAQRGVVALHFNQVDAFLYRAVHDHNNQPGQALPGSLVRAEGWGATGLRDADLAYDFAGDTYDFYSQYHKRNSIDNRGMSLISTVRYCPYPMGCETNTFPNAFWNGYQMVYGDGFASADDVVSHELTHGVTEFSSNLFYYYQSGAINEALSDIWGEFVDLTNGKGNDSSNVRWLMGEDLPPSIGAIRSMKNPPLFGDPDKMSSSNYYCAADDNGGVHYNSGIANKAAYLMADGDTFNGKTIRGLGLEKTALIWYEAQVGMLTSAADYNDLYYSLQTSCAVLSGTPYTQAGSAQVPASANKLFVPFAMNRLRFTGITAEDCQEVKKALDAVEMYARPPASCFTTAAPMCSTAGSKPVSLFSDNLENLASGNWTAGPSGFSRWYYPPPPYARYATSGQNNLWGDNHYDVTNSYIMLNRGVNLPAGTSYLHFKHAYSFEPGGFDGGVIEYSTNNGAAWADAASFFPTLNGYTGTISNLWQNPLGGRSAYTNSSYGYTASRLDLTKAAGNSIRFRFRIGTDSSMGDYGWFIDDLNIYTCSPANP